MDSGYWFRNIEALFGGFQGQMSFPIRNGAYSLDSETQLDVDVSFHNEVWTFQIIRADRRVMTNLFQNHSGLGYWIKDLVGLSQQWIEGFLGGSNGVGIDNDECGQDIPTLKGFVTGSVGQLKDFGVFHDFGELLEHGLRKIEVDGHRDSRQVSPNELLEHRPKVEF